MIEKESIRERKKRDREKRNTRKTEREKGIER